MDIGFLQNFVRSATVSTKPFRQLSRQLNWTPQSRSCAKGGTEGTQAWPHERRCPEEAVPAAQAKVGAGEDEAEGEGGVETLQSWSVCPTSGKSGLPLRR